MNTNKEEPKARPPLLCHHVWSDTHEDHTAHLAKKYKDKIVYKTCSLCGSVSMKNNESPDIGSGYYDYQSTQRRDT